MKKTRLDVLLVERGLCESRERARAAVMAGLVYVGGQKEEKPGTPVSPDAVLDLRGDPIGFVSRGGLKLQRAFDVFPFSAEDLNCIDVGASTGGFTDCLLKHGARHVWAVDVGYGQLDWRLRQDERVTVMERTNARHLRPEHFPCALDVAVSDLSFISLRLIFPVLSSLLREGGQAICLVKPQFEAGREQVGKKGVVRDATVHREVLRSTLRAALHTGFVPCGVNHSPIKGPEGNIEFLLYLRRECDPVKENILTDERLVSEWDERLLACVNDAHIALTLKA